MVDGLTEQHFQNRQELEEWLDEWIASKQNFFLQWNPDLWENVAMNNGEHF